MPYLQRIGRFLIHQFCDETISSIRYFKADLVKDTLAGSETALIPQNPSVSAVCSLYDHAVVITIYTLLILFF